MRRFDNRTVIVSNGARGMGASHVRGFVGEGHGRPQLDGIRFREFVDFMRRPGGSLSGLLRWQHFQGWSTVTIDGDRATARTPHIHTHTRGETDGKGWNLVQAGCSSTSWSVALRGGASSTAHSRFSGWTPSRPPG